ncbi:nuclear transport factor 2 family protein [Pseudooceanicola sp. HF7]|uniref:nuclear transport factor 2 family protein n=1 Tax=Pseudooceanicola sp. HF7 TaxID=2721560 RepID=UPI001431F2BD|nr:nuclear transport factor 2 family protein [Pseudooceanicola sp. HF7]NIZ08550.1 nuclear transport factor 2 family protein [Pseudooceanicola sp. HF7]
MLEAIEQTLWNEERTLWTSGVDSFAERITPFCLMAFPGAGILKGKEILEGLKEAPRWTSVKMLGKRVSEHHGAAVLAYRAQAVRARTAELYECWCTSCWVVRRGRWQMIQHQRTPIDPGTEVDPEDTLVA